MFSNKTDKKEKQIWKFTQIQNSVNSPGVRKAGESPRNFCPTKLNKEGYVWDSGILTGSYVYNIFEYFPI